MGSYNLIPGPLDNRHDPLRLGITGKEATVSVLTEAVNVDIDAANTVTPRLGRTLALSGTPHSLWAHPQDDTLAFFVEASVLKQLNTDDTATTLAALTSNSPMAYQPVNNEVVASNGVEIGWASRSGFDLFAPALAQFELAMPAGQYLAFFNGCLVVAAGSVLYVSKPWNAERRDSRMSEFPLNGYIRMVGAVTDGLYVATEAGVAFLAGGGVDDFTYRKISNDTPADGCFSTGFEQVGNSKQPLVRWASPEGFCIGRSGGQYENLSKDRIVLPSGSRGRHFHVDDNGNERHIAVIHDPTLTGAYVAPELTVNTITVI